MPIRDFFYSLNAQPQPPAAIADGRLEALVGLARLKRQSEELLAYEAEILPKIKFPEIRASLERDVAIELPAFIRRLDEIAMRLAQSSENS